jgi:hypothetical protein
LFPKGRFPNPDFVPPDPAVARLTEICPENFGVPRSIHRIFIAGLCLLTGVAVSIHHAELAGLKVPAVKRSADSVISGQSQPATPAAPVYEPAAQRDYKKDYTAIVRKAAKRHRVDPRLIAAIIEIESGGNPRAVSFRGAKGLMQLMPAVCRKYSVSDPFNVEQNIHAGTAYFAYLLRVFRQNKEHALAAYNCGLKHVFDCDGVPPGQARQFVDRIFACYDGCELCESNPQKVNTRGSA